MDTASPASGETRGQTDPATENARPSSCEPRHRRDCAGPSACCLTAAADVAEAVDVVADAAEVRRAVAGAGPGAVPVDAAAAWAPPSGARAGPGEPASVAASHAADGFPAGVPVPAGGSAAATCSAPWGGFPYRRVRVSGDGSSDVVAVAEVFEAFQPVSLRALAGAGPVPGLGSPSAHSAERGPGDSDRPAEGVPARHADGVAGQGPAQPGRQPVRLAQFA